MPAITGTGCSAWPLWFRSSLPIWLLSPGSLVEVVIAIAEYVAE